jgi:hypothetical protein
VGYSIFVPKLSSGKAKATGPDSRKSDLSKAKMPIEMKTSKKSQTCLKSKMWAMMKGMTAQMSGL